MGFLDTLVNDPTTQQRVQDFIGRYEQGAPADGVSDQEALQHHQQLAAEATPQQYQQAAQASFARLAPGDRAQIGQRLQQAAQGRGLDLKGLLGDATGQLAAGEPGTLAQLAAGEPGTLAQLAGRLQQQHPGLLGELLRGGSSSSTGSSNTGSGSGSSASGAGGGVGGMLSSPAARAALAGIAATLAKRVIAGYR